MQTLLVDDEIVAVNALKRRVDWSKFHVEKAFMAKSMQEAQDIFRQEKIDFMLCDIEMPNGSGLELFEWVKIYYPATECIYITCHPEYEYIRKALKKPATFISLTLSLCHEAVARAAEKIFALERWEN